MSLIKSFNLYSVWISTLFLFSFSLFWGCKNEQNTEPSANIWPDSIYFEYFDLEGIGIEEGVTRRDPSDVIKVNEHFYVYYTKVFGRAPGYWGTIWAAKSKDGIKWEEIGEVLGTGPEGEFDSHATFTPNILQYKDRFYLYYTAVKPTPGMSDFENNSKNDYTAIGVAVSDNPEGPFKRTGVPVISVDEDTTKFDSYRVDDAALAVKNDTIYLYYKGRNYKDGSRGPLFTKMGVAFSNSPTGPFEKYPKAILDKSHEVLIWKKSKGIAALASFSSTIEYAEDWVDFRSDSLGFKVENRPLAPGLFRVDLSKPNITEEPAWGISLIHSEDPYLIGFRIIRVEK